MDSNCIIIDPNGDALRVLRQHAGRLHASLIKNGGDLCLPLAHQCQRPPGGQPLDHLYTTIQNTDELRQTPISSSSSSHSSTSTLVNEPNEPIHTHSGDNVPVLQTTEPTAQFTHCIKFLVSSKRLCFASHAFQERLSQPNVHTETSETQTTEILPCYLPNLDALYILLNIMHCRTRQVPRTLNLQVLCTVAVLTQHYGCLEAVEAFARTWLGKLQHCFPKTYSHDLPQWMLVSRVFHHHGLFRLVTKIALRESTAPITTNGLGIPMGLIDLMNKIRQFRIEEIFIALYERMEYLLDHQVCCPDCDHLMIGTLVHQLKSRGLYPPPLIPYEGLSLDYVLKTVDEMKESRCKELVHDKVGCSGAKCLLNP
ncbi:uncharacterized protein BO97DRAFT_419571 [Aspergillus homomorphus CBS 101889]|uniref:BTB domain-containing protein n=1 Tax=Aspergillus homomorphus (strain CBS 101889) TaxID=1450537 RepID=A0A395IAX1_ASPHC|nr:hypothetical protein BO97DRAFT_419571 [Aspergillus homomorphus CBS 101889]RAL17327.1 hypothetical protein BO97DRAFT_419571 [Aspergillus homomorphus CBS 101889]